MGDANRQGRVSQQLAGWIRVDRSARVQQLGQSCARVMGASRQLLPTRVAA